MNRFIPVDRVRAASGTRAYFSLAVVPLIALATACGEADDPSGEGTGGFGAVPGYGGGTPGAGSTVGAGNTPGGGGSTGTGGGAAAGGGPGAGGNVGNGGGFGTGGGVGNGGAVGVGGNLGTGGSVGGAGGGSTGGTPGTGGGSEADYKDPGKGAWQKVTPEDCGMDGTKFADSGVGNYAVFRYGKLCKLKGSEAAGSMFSATKTLGATMVGRAAYLTKDVAKSGPGTGTINPQDKATDWLSSVSYNREATLAHVMAMCGHSANLAYGSKRFTYDTVGSTQINTMIQVVEKNIGQVPALGRDAVGFVRAQIFDKLGMTSSSWSPALGISTGWTANLADMGKLGTLLLHDGYYGGERLLSREWVYRMSHPAFEDANTSYGQLTWLNHRGNAAGIGGNISTGANAPQGDPCAPPAFWPSYPQPISTAPDCRATIGTCQQTYDVGVFSAQGLQGQFIVVHPGLDLVIAARNFSGGDGPMGLWRAVRPAVVAKDPKYKGDEAAFCKDYGSGNYAPDLVMPRRP